MDKHLHRNHLSENPVHRQRILHAAPQLNTTICGPKSGNVNQGNGGGGNDNTGDGGWVIIKEALFLPCRTAEALVSGVPIPGWLKLNDTSTAGYRSSGTLQCFSKDYQSNANTVLRLNFFAGLPEITRIPSSDSLVVEAPASDPSSMESSGIVPVDFAAEVDFGCMGAGFTSFEVNADLAESQYVDILGQQSQGETWLWLTAQSQWGQGPHHLHNPHYASSASTNTTTEEEECED